MSGIKFMFNGRSVRPQDIGKVLQESVRQSVRDDVAKRLRQVRCPVHGASPRVTSSPGSSGKLEWRIEGCCEDVVQRAKAVVGAD